jgi:lycopene cyclase domain-containing protein
MIITGIPFVTWDIIATERGDWGFNYDHTLPIRIFNLPVEEILFFITVPYSMIFLYKTFSLYVKDFKINSAPYITAAAGLAFVTGAFIYTENNYAFTLVFGCSLFIFAALIFNRKMLKSGRYWLFMLFSFIPFFTVNLILTYLPVVWYNPGAIIGIRVISVPVEDFLYSFTLVSFYLLFFLRFEEKWERKRLP